MFPCQILGALPCYTSYSLPAPLQLGVQGERRLSKPQLKVSPDKPHTKQAVKSVPSSSCCQLRCEVGT